MSETKKYSALKGVEKSVIGGLIFALGYTLPVLLSAFGSFFNQPLVPALHNLLDWAVNSFAPFIKDMSIGMVLMFIYNWLKVRAEIKKTTPTT